MATTASNPLLEIHQQTQAEFQAWGDVEIVQTFGEPQAEYSAIHKSAGLIDLPQRGILELTGNEGLSFLNNLLTNQTWDKSTKSGLAAGQGVYAFMLNLKGRLVADMNVLELGDRTWLEMDARFVEPLRQAMEKYLFAEKVSLKSRLGELHEIALHGPAAALIVGCSLDKELQSIRIKLFDIDAVVWRDDPTGSPGYHVVVPTDSAASLWTRFISEFGEALHTGRRNLRPVGWAAFNSTRIEAGRPIFGIDFDGAPIASALPGKRDESQSESGGAGSLPAETGLLHRAVSFTKGCYLGQEIVARMDARKQIARQVAGFRMEGDWLPLAGAEVFDEPQTGTVGVVTSSTISPMLSNAAIGLAVIKRPHFSVGTRLQIPAEGAIRPASVAETPFLTQANRP